MGRIVTAADFPGLYRQANIRPFEIVKDALLTKQRLRQNAMDMDIKQKKQANEEKFRELISQALDLDGQLYQERLAQEAGGTGPSVQQTFDPEGSGYDYESAKKAGLSPGEDGHWPSRDPKTGLLLKGRGHETFQKTIAGENEAGYEIYKGEDGRYYSKKRFPSLLKETVQRASDMGGASSMGGMEQQKNAMAPSEQQELVPSTRRQRDRLISQAYALNPRGAASVYAMVSNRDKASIAGLKDARESGIEFAASLDTSDPTIFKEHFLAMYPTVVKNASDRYQRMRDPNAAKEFIQPLHQIKLMLERGETEDAVRAVEQYRRLLMGPKATLETEYKKAGRAETKRHNLEAERNARARTEAYRAKTSGGKPQTTSEKRALLKRKSDIAKELQGIAQEEEFINTDSGEVDMASQERKTTLMNEMKEIDSMLGNKQEEKQTKTPVSQLVDKTTGKVKAIKYSDGSIEYVGK